MGIVRVMDPEVNMSAMMAKFKVQSLLTQFVIRREMKADPPTYKVDPGMWDGGEERIWGDAEF